MPNCTYHLEALGLCIAEYRRFAVLSRASLARSSGISLDLLQSLEQRRHRNPSLNTLIRLADGLGISVGELLAVSSELGPGHFRGVARATPPKADRGLVRARALMRSRARPCNLA